MKVSTYRLSTKELATLVKRVLESSKSGKYQIVENNQLLLELEKQYHDYEKVYTKVSYSGKGDEVAEADAQRDKIFVNIKNYLRVYSKFELLSNFEIASELYAIVKKYGTQINVLNYAEQSAQLNKLIVEFSQTENQDKLTSLNLKPAYEKLVEAQQRFETLYSEQAEANAELRSLPTATALRKNVEKALKNYLNLLTALKDVTEWQLLYAEINELVKGVK